MVYSFSLSGLASPISLFDPVFPTLDPHVSDHDFSSALLPSPLLRLECRSWFIQFLSFGSLRPFLSLILFVILARRFLITILLRLCSHLQFT